MKSKIKFLDNPEGLCDLFAFELRHLVRLSFAVVVVVVVAAADVVVVERVALVAVSNEQWQDVPTCGNPSMTIESPEMMTRASSVGTSKTDCCRRRWTSDCLERLIGLNQLQKTFQDLNNFGCI